MGLNTELNLVEMVELTNHPWFVGAVSSRVEK